VNGPSASRVHVHFQADPACGPVLVIL
jgi:hypothetical protein